jgi:hypothetical protein
MNTAARRQVKCYICSQFKKCGRRQRKEARRGRVFSARSVFNFSLSVVVFVLLVLVLGGDDDDVNSKRAFSVLDKCDRSALGAQAIEI